METHKIAEAYGTVDLKMLQELSEADGISGNEKEATRVMKQYLEGYADEFHYDNLGSLIALKKGAEDGPRIMIAGHVDEVGFIVKSIDDNGFVRITPIGGWWAHVLPSQGMILTTRDGKKLDGVIGCRAPHGLPADVRNKVMDLNDLFLDLGVESKADVLALNVNIGDMITPDTKFKVLNNPNFLMGKAWDDRIGAAVAIDVVRNLQGVNHEANVYAVGSVQEEVGLRGAKTSAAFVKPDIAFALDVTIANDTPNSPAGMKMGAGLVLAMMDASHLTHRGLFEKVEAIAMDLGLDINYDAMTAGGTDTGEIHKYGEGVIAMTLSLPSRYIHSHRSLIHRKDYVQTVEVITEFIKRCDRAMLEEIRTFNR
ncbi:MAG: M42 family metallopeptidase [Erysipelotrichaceae bacterium]